LIEDAAVDNLRPSLDDPAMSKDLDPIYEPDTAHREKHRGGSSEPRLIEQDGALVGKCSSDIDRELAQRLLDDGIHWSPQSHRSPLPKAIFNTFEGIPYRAHRRGNTRFYHGFPDVKNRIPRVVREQLRERAAKEGKADAFDRWMLQTDKYP
jgi:hypothetical protein